MPSSQKRIEANRRNSLRSTGPSPAGRLVSRGNALKHGLTCLVVVPGEEAGAVAARVELLQDSLAPEGDPLTLILARQAAFLSVQSERAFRYLTATAAERARNAEEDAAEARRARADQLLDTIGCEPLTNHRRLMSFAEGCDLLIRQLEGLAAVGLGGAPWEDGHATWLDMYTGHRPGRLPLSRAQALSDIITRDCTTGLDAAEVEGLDRGGRALWAMAELRRLIAAEVEKLRAHRATLDPARHALNAAQSPDRAVLGFDHDEQLARRYHLAAVRLLQRTNDQIRARRRDLARAAAPAEVVAAAAAAASPDLPPMPPALASFCASLDGPAASADASTFTIGKPPVAPRTGPKPPRHTP